MSVVWWGGGAGSMGGGERTFPPCWNPSCLAGALGNWGLSSKSGGRSLTCTLRGSRCYGRRTVGRWSSGQRRLGRSVKYSSPIKQARQGCRWMFRAGPGFCSTRAMLGRQRMRRPEKGHYTLHMHPASVGALIGCALVVVGAVSSVSSAGQVL